VLSSSRSWGGQPTASYSGNGIAVTPEQQFADQEFGPTRHDERHRVVASAVIDLPAGFQVAPIFQWATARPYTPTTGYDINGDGLTNSLDRLCAGVDLDAVFAVRGNATAVRALNANGCTPATPGSQRSGFVVNADGTIEERSGNYVNLDLRLTKSFSLGQRAKFKVYADLYNVFNTETLSFNLRTPRTDESQAIATTFLQPLTLYGPGFGTATVGKPFTASIGARIEF
jgi:hypothetical protein